MIDGLAEAFLHNEHKVLGYKLKPFSCAHYAMLDALKSPLVGHTHLVGKRDLIVALSVCSLSNPFDWTLTGKDWGKLLFLTDLRFKRGVKKFGFYVQDYLDIPETYSKQKNDNDLFWHTPPVLSIVTKAAHYFGMTLDQCWHYPMGLLCWHIRSHEELNGGGRIIDPEKQRLIVEEAKRAQAEAMNNA